MLTRRSRAHRRYPETEFEMEAAWEVLAPGGYLVGDDFDHYWPEVQQSVNEFVLRHDQSEFADPSELSTSWPTLASRRDFGRVALVRVLISTNIDYCLYKQI